MFYKKVFFTFLVALVGFVSSVAAQASDKNIPTLSYSDLMQHKEQYLGEIVRVKAFHIWGFEWSFLCDTDCKKQRRETWVEYEGDLCKGSKKKLKSGSDKYFDNKAEVIYVGKLSSGNFGDGSYRYQFTVSCVEKFKFIKPK